MRIVTGNVVTGDDFFEGRLPVVAKLGEMVSRSDVLLVGPRRTGKTSVIKEYLRQQEDRDPGFKSIFINLESTSNLYEFYVKIIREILRVTRQWKLALDKSEEIFRTSVNALHTLFDGKIDIAALLGLPSETQITINLPKFEQRKVAELRQRLEDILRDISVPLVIVLDEFPELIWKLGKEAATPEEESVLRKDQTSLMLAGLRTIRQQSNDSTKHKIIIAGSVNLINTLRYLDLDQQINDIEKLEINDLTPDQSVSLFERLAQPAGLRFSPTGEYIQFITQQFGVTSPFYIQGFAQLLVQLRIDRGGEVEFSPADLGTCYKQLLQSGGGPRYLRNRIERYYQTLDQQFVLSMLELVAKNQFEKKIATAEKDCVEFALSKMKEQFTRLQQSDLLAKMNADNLVDMRSDAYHFESQFLCNFWYYTLVGTDFLA